MDLPLLSSIATQLMTSTQVKVDKKILPVRRTSSQRLKAVSFEMDGKKYEAIEQNPEKPSRWGSSPATATRSCNSRMPKRTASSRSRLMEK
jgi:hypothetical protein